MGLEPMPREPFPRDRRGAGEMRRTSEGGPMSPGTKLIIFILLAIAGMLHLLSYHMMAGSGTTPNEAPALGFTGD
jgi:hypothetical protein